MLWGETNDVPVEKTNCKPLMIQVTDRMLYRRDSDSHSEKGSGQTL